MSDNVLTTARFSEPFTLYVNAAGSPVQRTLREMTAGEVLAAIEWHADEAERLEREAAPFAKLGEIIEAGGELPADMASDDIKAAAAVLRRAGEAQMRCGRLMQLVQINMPQWHRHPGMKLAAAVHQFWPGGRAA